MTCGKSVVCVKKMARRTCAFRFHNFGEKRKIMDFLTWAQTEALRLVVEEAILNGQCRPDDDPTECFVWNEALELFYVAHDAIISAGGGEPLDDLEELARSAGRDAIGRLVNRKLGES